MTRPDIGSSPRHGDRSKVRGLSTDQHRAIRRLAIDVGDCVREFRRSLNLTQTEFGRRYGVSGERINHIECAVNPNLSFGTAIRMLNDVGYTLSIVPRAAA